MTVEQGTRRRIVDAEIIKKINENPVKREMFDRLFSETAVNGGVRTFKVGNDEISKHIDGYRQTFPLIPQSALTQILEDGIIRLYEATILNHQHGLLIGDLRKAERAALKNQVK